MPTLTLAVNELWMKYTIHLSSGLSQATKRKLIQTVKLKLNTSVQFMFSNKRMWKYRIACNWSVHAMHIITSSPDSKPIKTVLNSAKFNFFRCVIFLQCNSIASTIQLSRKTRLSSDLDIGRSRSCICFSSNEVALCVWTADFLCAYKSANRR